MQTTTTVPGKDGEIFENTECYKCYKMGQYAMSCQWVEEVKVLEVSDDLDPISENIFMLKQVYMPTRAAGKVNQLVDMLNDNVIN